MELAKNFDKRKEELKKEELKKIEDKLEKIEKIEDKLEKIKDEFKQGIADSESLIDEKAKQLQAYFENEKHFQSTINELSVIQEGMEKAMKRSEGINPKISELSSETLPSILILVKENKENIEEERKKFRSEHGVRMKHLEDRISELSYKIEILKEYAKTLQNDGGRPKISMQVSGDVINSLSDSNDVDIKKDTDVKGGKDKDNAR